MFARLLSIPLFNTERLIISGCLLSLFGTLSNAILDGFLHAESELAFFAFLQP